METENQKVLSFEVAHPVAESDLRHSVLYLHGKMIKVVTIVPSGHIVGHLTK